MYHQIVHLLQELKPDYILLVDAVIIVLFPYFLWRICKLDKHLPLGVVQICSGVLLGPAILGAIDANFLSPELITKALPFNACTAPDKALLWDTLFGKSCYHGTGVDRTVLIGAIATIAVCMFGFLAGADADKELIAKSGRSIASIGVIGMLFGWGLAIIAGYVIYQVIPSAKGPNSNAFSFSVAYGLVIAVSALPVLAVILRGLDITRRRLGAVALASASIADTIMWLGLGIVVALTLGGDLRFALAKAAAGGILSVGFIKFVAGPIFDRMYMNNAPESAIITMAALCIFVASAITGITELHPVLGAFVAGFFLPDKVRETAAHRFDLMTTLVLMPFFFLNTGLKTQFSFSDPNVWILFGVSSFLCVFGKMIGHGIAARMMGESWPFAMSVGLLLQTKGLMGLIVIVVFLEKGVVSPLMFSAAVFMCMFSTALSTPAMRWMFKRYGEGLKDGDPALGGAVKSSVPATAAVPAAGGLVGEPRVSVNSGRMSSVAHALASLEFKDEDTGKTDSVDIVWPRTLIGRHSSDDVRVADVRVSRNHAMITHLGGGKFEIVNNTADRSEPNPIMINGVTVERAQVKDGDKVMLGGVPFTFRKAA